MIVTYSLRIWSISVRIPGRERLNSFAEEVRDESDHDK